MDTCVSGYGHGSEGGGGGWPGLRQVVCVRTRREPLAPGKPVVVEDHFYLTSLRPRTRRGAPGALLAAARGHWAIENRLHHVKDRTMGEDAGRCRRGATVLARLRSLGVGLLAQMDEGWAPLKRIAVAANPLGALRLLKQKSFPKLRRKDF